LRASRRRRWLRRAVALGLPLLLGLAYGVQAWKARRDLQRALSAHDAQDRAEAAGMERRAFEVFDRWDGDRDAAEGLWARALHLGQRADDAYLAAGQSLEAALLLSAGHRESLRLLGEVAYDRVLLLERLSRQAQRDELV